MLNPQNVFFMKCINWERKGNFKQCLCWLHLFFVYGLTSWHCVVVRCLL